jgi:hypothetical protein
MKKNFVLSLLLNVGIFTLCISLLSYGINLLNKGLISDRIGIMVAFFFIITSGALGLILLKFNKNPDSFSKYYFITMAGRLFLGVLFVWAGLILITENRIIFVSNFLVLYLLFLGFEIYYLITNFQSRTRK